LQTSYNFPQIYLSKDILPSNLLKMLFELLLKVLLHGKNDFAKVSKHLARYRSENNFVIII